MLVVLFHVIAFSSQLRIPSRYPLGTYYAEVSTMPFMPTQKIEILIEKERPAKIFLSGLVNVDDDFTYGYESENGVWWSKFNSKIENVLTKFRCVLKDFHYDDKNDCAVINIVVPVLGRKKIVMRQIRTHEACQRL